MKLGLLIGNGSIFNLFSYNAFNTKKRLQIMVKKLGLASKKKQ